MEVKCPVCDKSFPHSLITYHAEHCLYSSFGDQASGNKCNIAEEGSSASYPRKRQQYAGHHSPPSTTTTVAYYPKESADYRRVGRSSSDSWSGKTAPPWTPQRSSKPTVQAYNRQSLKARRESGAAKLTHPYIRELVSRPPPLTRPPPPLAPPAYTTQQSSTRPPLPSLLTKISTPSSNTVTITSPSTKVIPSNVNQESSSKPCLVELLRPTCLSELVGRIDTLRSVRRTLNTAHFTNTILWGPPGCGKSSLGNILRGVCGGTAWKLRCVQGSSVTAPMLRTVLSTDIKTVIFLEELHCLPDKLQLLLSSRLERTDVILLATSLCPPTEGVCQALLSRCRIVSMPSLEPCHLETIVERALRRVTAHVLDGPVAEEEAEYQQPYDRTILTHDNYTNSGSWKCNSRTDRTNSGNINTKISEKNDSSNNNNNNDVNINPDTRQDFPSKKLSVNESVIVLPSSHKGICEIKSEPVEIKPEYYNSTDITNSNRNIKNHAPSATRQPNEAVTPGIQQSSRLIKDNGIEDMSEDEDESILDVLTKDMDQIGSEFSAIEQQQAEPLSEPLDCVSDEELPDQRTDLESIDSSDEEDELDQETHLNFSSVGISRGAVVWLCGHCGGDGRGVLAMLLLLLRQARVRANRAKAMIPQHNNNNNKKSNNTSASSSQPWQVNYTETNKTRIANYGHPKTLENADLNNTSSKVAASSSMKDGKLPTTDEISSDEEEVTPVISKASGTPGELDNVSDVSDNSVHGRPTQQLDSDDVLSDALSDDALDYDEIPDEISESHINKARLSKLKEPIVPVIIEEKNHVANFSNNLTSTSRLSTSTFDQGQQHPPAPNQKTTKSSLKGAAKRPQRGRLVPINFKSVAPKQDSGVMETSRRTVWAVITVRHVRELLKDQGCSVGSRRPPLPPHQTVSASSCLLQEALVSSITHGSCDAALYYVARLLHADQHPAAVAATLLQAAVSVVGVGDVSCLPLAVQCCQAVPLLTAPHTQYLLANTALTLARARKDQSAVTGIAAATKHVTEATTLPASNSATGITGLPRQLGDLSFLSTTT